MLVWLDMNAACVNGLKSTLKKMIKQEDKKADPCTLSCVFTEQQVMEKFKYL